MKDAPTPAISRLSKSVHSRSKASWWDTGANLLCLPQRMVEQLGLPVLEVAQARTAAGYSKMNIHEDAKITLMGRSGTFDCIALPDDAEPLLGLLPLERLGLEPDLQHETLRVLPNFGPDTYWTA